MTDLTRTFIPVTSDTANARSFAEAVETGSDDAARHAREDACRFAFGSDKRWLVHAQRLWSAMRDDMRQIIDTARQSRGYADMADLTRAGYCEQAVEAYLRAANGVAANDEGTHPGEARKPNRASRSVARPSASYGRSEAEGDSVRTER